MPWPFMSGGRQEGGDLRTDLSNEHLEDDDDDDDDERVAGQEMARNDPVIGTETLSDDGKDGSPMNATKSHGGPTLENQSATAKQATNVEVSEASTRPQLQSKATTAVSLTDVQAPEQSPESRAVSRQPSISYFNRPGGRRMADMEDNASIRSVRSFSGSMLGGGDVESLLGDILDRDTGAGPRDNALSAVVSGVPLQHEYEDVDFAFEREFDELEDFEMDGSNEEALITTWHAKLKQFLILSSAGKPIYSRHGHDQLISNTIGVFQTIISVFQGEDDVLRSFTSGSSRFLIQSKGHLHLVAITRLEESESQLSAQLDALYMQILSTLTYPQMQRMFLSKPSTDLRRPLQGTEALLSALADSFTRGSPSTLLSALECLKLRKTHRQAINNALLKVKSPNLLYGLVVAGGRLVSVLRPKKHSLHPGDLQLIFNMLFEAEGIRAGGGENWIPLCLPGFNNTGYLYMYVKFRSAMNPHSEIEERPALASGHSDEIATILISANKESFFELKQMGDDLIAELESTGSLSVLCAAIGKGRVPCADVSTGSSLAHFLYKSRANVQFTMPTAEPHFKDPVAWRRLMSVYASLHGAVHGKTTHLKVHSVSGDRFTALTWVNPVFELYCIAPANTPGTALAQAATKVVQWAYKEEQRLFIIGGAVF